MLRAIQFVLVAVVLLATCAIAQATHIPLLVDSNTGNVILDDNFEGQTLGYVPNSPGVPAPVGTWHTVYTNQSYAYGSSFVDVASPAAYGVAAYEGAQFVAVNRNPLGEGYSGSIQGPIGTGVAANSGTSDVITLTVAYYLFSGPGSAVYAHDGSGAVFGSILLAGAGTIGVLDSTGTIWQYLTQTGPTGAWNTLVVTHTNGTSDWTVSVNGQMPETRTGASGSGKCWSGVSFCPGGDNTGAFFDAVPEPSTLALLAGGLIGLLCYAWRRKRK
ncbi:MAG: LamG domain-containing protein [Planctomycetes bacterium]|nr:LamG domain-containing protein [Planctomycetota bacterium]MCG2683894.1 LamG domain-containing protein [Planctomycetales bacterium]